MHIIPPTTYVPPPSTPEPQRPEPPRQTGPIGPSMTIARVHELMREMAAAPTPVVCSFTHEQLTDLMTEVDRRIQTAPVPLTPAPVEINPVKDFATHRRACDRCRRGGAERCETGDRLYGYACAWLMDQTRLLL